VIPELPQSLEAEQAVLGSLLIDGDAFARIADRLHSSDFLRPDHRLIFAAIRASARNKSPHDTVTVAEELRRLDQLDDAGGLAYLGQLVRETPTSANIETYAKTVRDRSTARRAIELADDISASCMTRQRDITEVLGHAERELAHLKTRCEDPESRRTRLNSIEVHDFLSLKIPPRTFLLEPTIPEQGLVMIYGPRGLGKTQVSVGIAIAVASGGRFLKWSAPKPAGVLLIDGEMPAGAMQKRLADAIEASEREPQASLRIISPDLNWDAGMPDLSTLDGQRAVDALIRDDTRLLIVDNLSSLLRTGVENDAESWLPLQTWALRHRAAGRSVLFIHHAGKGGAQRGTSRREDVPYAVRATTGRRTVHALKFTLRKAGAYSARMPTRLKRSSWRI
jgi:DnaB-like helicase N terminal domain/AAA domain